ncbi:MAG TPA: crosslink repair DNA glycosylase YcaQ family protein, partial [Trinickia sp.]|nr:crosslink repair DNA glycosylase YcaQ family protein [Trinickia sp.]
PPADAVQQTLVARTCRALGVIRADWIADYYRLAKRPYAADLHALADAGEVIPVRVEGWKEDVFVSRELEPLIDDAANSRVRSTVTTLLSPFDPVVWDRKRATALFDFDYAIECYTPAAKRKFGYFCLPVLSRGKLVGRVDAKAHRASSVFELKAVHVEPGVRIGTGFIADLRRAVQRCADWHGTPQIAVGSAPRKLAEGLLAVE